MTPPDPAIGSPFRPYSSNTPCLCYQWEVIRLYIALALALSVAAQTPRSREPGPVPGERVPSFEAIDQNGQKQTLASIAGPKGAVLVFYRSADW